MTKSKTFSFLILIIALLVFSYQVVRFDYVVDDAFISMRYARNWIEGHGITFNPGASERIEGYTNFLFVALLALCGKLGANLLHAAKAIGILSALGCMGLMALLLKEVGQGSDSFRVFALACLILASVGPFPLWAGAGLETILFTLLLLLSVWCFLFAREKKNWTPWAVCGLSFALLTLCRPEGLGLFGLTVIYILIDSQARRRTGKPVDFTVLVPLAWAFLIVIGPHFIWRYFYYGHWLPNTYHAKVSWSPAQAFRGLRYLYNFFNEYNALFLMTLVGLAIKNELLKRSSYLLLVGCGYLTYVVSVGGDGLPMYRFVVPALPFIALFAAFGFILCLLQLIEAKIPGVLKRVVLQLLAALLFARLLIVPSFEGHQALYVENDREQVADRIAIGKWLAENKPGTTIAVNAAGAIPYYSNLTTIDMLGLNDPRIARAKSTLPKSDVAGHERSDPEYVLSLAPDIIVPGRNELLNNPGQLFIWLPGDQALLSNPAFQDNYEKVSESLPGGFFTYFQKKKRKVSFSHSSPMPDHGSAGRPS